MPVVLSAAKDLAERPNGSVANARSFAVLRMTREGDFQPDFFTSIQ